MLENDYVRAVRVELAGNWDLGTNDLDKLLCDPSNQYEVLRWRALGQPPYVPAAQIADRHDLFYHGKRHDEEEGVYDA